MDTVIGENRTHNGTHTPEGAKQRKKQRQARYRAKLRQQRLALQAAQPARPHGRRSEATDEQLHPDAPRPVSLAAEQAAARAVKAKTAAAQARPSRKRAERQSPHPGVGLLPPSGRHDWRAKFIDPVSGRERKVTLPRYRNGTAELRAAWAIELSESMQRERDTRLLGSVAAAPMALGAAIDEWLASERTWADGTQRCYDLATRALRDYLSERRPTDAIDKAMLMRYRTFLQTAPRLRARNGEAGPLAAKTINQYLTIAKTFLRWAHDTAGLRVSLDAIAQALKAIPDPHERRAFMSRDQIAATMRAAQAESAAAYEALRLLLLTGLRLQEALAIRWCDVEPGDRIKLPSGVVKTRQLRDVDLTVTSTALPRRGDRKDTDKVLRITRQQLRHAIERIRKAPGVPAGLNALLMRRTCSTYFTNAFNPWRSAKSLGHSVQIAEKHYAGLVRMPEGKHISTLEQAMGLRAAPQLKLVVSRKPRKDTGVKRPIGKQRYADSKNPRHKGLRLAR